MAKTTEHRRAVQENARKERLALFGFGCICLLLAWRLVIAPHSDQQNVWMRDFVTPYTGSRCLVAHCNPYDFRQIEAEFARSGGTEADRAPWDWEIPLYPPSSLVVLLPTAIFAYAQARTIYAAFQFLCLAASLLGVAYLVERSRRHWGILAGATLLSTRVVGGLLGIGQPSAAAIGLSICGLVLMRRTQWARTATVLLGAGVGLKPQLGGALIYLLLFPSDTRRRALSSSVLALILLFVGIAWLRATPQSQSWLLDYQSQVHGALHGGVLDPEWSRSPGNSMLNLQAFFAVVTDNRALWNILAWSIAFAFLAIWTLWTYRATRSADSGRVRSGETMSLAALACINLLGTYHREYDLAFLVLTVPALINLLYARSRIGWIALLLTLPLLGSPFRPDGVYTHLGTAAATIRLVPNARLRTMLLARGQPIVILFLAGLYLAALNDAARKMPPDGTLECR